MPAGSIVSVGYGGRVLEELADQLVGLGVGVLVDVRLNAVSRKRGFSKNKLREGLAEAGIDYRHAKPLGTPLDVRPFFQTGDIETALVRYAPVLETTEARAELALIVDELSRMSVAILCLEDEHDVCHRQAVVERLEELTSAEVIRL